MDLEIAVSVSKEDVQSAWERAYAALEQALATYAQDATLYVVFGVQGAGKSTWVRENGERFGPGSIFFDGPLPSAAKRARALNLAKQYGVNAVAVWINTPLDVAMARNATRNGLAVIKTEAIQHVHGELEAPSLAEGFAQVLVVGGNET